MSTILSKHLYKTEKLADFIDIDLPYDSHLIKSFKKNFINLLLEWNSYGMNRSILSPTLGGWIKNIKTNSTSLKGPVSYICASRIEISLYDFSIYLQNIHLATLRNIWYKIPKNHKYVIQDKRNLALCIHILLCQAIKFKYPKSSWHPSTTTQTYAKFLDKLLTCLRVCIAHRNGKNFISPKSTVKFHYILEQFPLWMLYSDKILQLTKDLTDLKPICCNNEPSNIIYNKTSMFVSKKETLLIAGYIRKSVQYNVPDALASLCISYYTEIFLWHFEKDSLQTSLHLIACGFNLKQSPKTIDGIKFVAEICLNKNESLSFHLKIESIPSNISSITVYYELYFKEMGIEYMNILGFQQTDDILNWNNSSNVLIPLSTVQKYTRLNFGFFVKILSIQYNDVKHYNEIVPPMCIKQSIKWNLPIENQLCNYTTGKYIFQPVESDDNWMLFIAPNGRSVSEKGKCYFGIQLTRLPLGIDKVVCWVEMQLMGIIIWSDIYAFGVDKSRLEIGSIKAHKIKRTMQLNVTITILEVVGNLSEGSSFDTNALNSVLYGL